MQLHLIDGSTVCITRKTCAHYVPDRYEKSTCNWNITPLEIINDEEKGFFALGKWGCNCYQDQCGQWIDTPENFEQMIPISSVVKISDIGEW